MCLCIWNNQSHNQHLLEVGLVLKQRSGSLMGFDVGRMCLGEDMGHIFYARQLDLVVRCGLMPYKMEKEYKGELGMHSPILCFSSGLRSRYFL